MTKASQIIWVQNETSEQLGQTLSTLQPRALNEGGRKFSGPFSVQYVVTSEPPDRLNQWRERAEKEVRKEGSWAWTLTGHHKGTKQDPDGGNERAEHHHEANEQPETSSCRKTHPEQTISSGNDPSLFVQKRPTLTFRRVIYFKYKHTAASKIISKTTLAVSPQQQDAQIYLLF